MGASRGASGGEYGGNTGVHPEVKYGGVNMGGVNIGVHPGGLKMDAPPRSMHSWKYAPEDRRTTGGQYASYLNAFLLSVLFIFMVFWFINLVLFHVIYLNVVIIRWLIL